MKIKLIVYKPSAQVSSNFVLFKLIFIPSYISPVTLPLSILDCTEVAACRTRILHSRNYHDSDRKSDHINAWSFNLYRIHIKRLTIACVLFILVAMMDAILKDCTTQVTKGSHNLQIKLSNLVFPVLNLREINSFACI